MGLLSTLEGLAQHRLLDRLIRGRAWIGLVAFALIGIVTLQLGLLKLNGGIGRALEHEAVLQRENATLSIENSELSAGARVQTGAAKLGMASVPVGAVRFLSASGHGTAGKAAAVLAGAAHASAAAKAHEASSAEAEAQTSGPSGGAEPSGESSESSSAGQASAEAGASSGAAEESSSSDEASAASESPSSEAPSSEATASAPASEAEPSGGIAASSTGG
ncbi:MAG TPA: hypothetical protein VGF47_08760 [Solirubrobacteraceae bacterium]